MVEPAQKTQALAEAETQPAAPWLGYEYIVSSTLYSYPSMYAQQTML